MDFFLIPILKINLKTPTNNEIDFLIKGVFENSKSKI